MRRSEVVVLDVVNNERESFGLIAVVNNGDGGGGLGLAGIAFLVVLAVTEPLTELQSAFNFDDGGTVLLGQSADELLVLAVVAVSGEDADESLLAVKSLAHFIEALNET